jgi:hypothetical protein
MVRPGHISGPRRAAAAIGHPKQRCRHLQASCAP